jgi:hypothetical protein
MEQERRLTEESVTPNMRGTRDGMMEISIIIFRRCVEKLTSEEIVQNGWSSLFMHSVAVELRNPADNVQRNGELDIR